MESSEPTNSLDQEPVNLTSIKHEVNNLDLDVGIRFDVIINIS